MDSEALKKLEATLWESADNLRANSKLTATEYSMPVLGLIFLRYATNRFEKVKAEVQKHLPSRGGVTREVTSDDFIRQGAIFLPKTARYDYLAELPESEDLGTKLKEAMEAIEQQVPELLSGVLPKEYPQFEPELLRDLVRVFNRDFLRTTTRDDVFGRIYEYFLNNFAMSGAQEGGEFFTPPSLVRTIVRFIEPTHGQILDPAVGSAGMFVQAAYAMEAAGDKPAEVATFFGQEKTETNTKLALMNLAVHGLEGKIIQGNTFYDRIEDKVGKCDFVMANPPFNVDMVDPKKLKNDPRMLVTVKELGISTKTKTVSNANYLWIQYFHGYLNDTGRAGFVMAQSATDAGSKDQDIRQKLVETGDVDIMVSIGTNFFYTRSLPCSLWFFDKGKPAERKHTTLMLDARNMYRVVSRKIRDFSDEQLQNLSAIVWLYREQQERYLSLVANYLQQTVKTAQQLEDTLTPFDATHKALTGHLDTIIQAPEPNADEEQLEQLTDIIVERDAAQSAYFKTRDEVLNALRAWLKDGHGTVPQDNAGQRTWHDDFLSITEQLKALKCQIGEVRKQTKRAFDVAKKQLKATSWGVWDNRAINRELAALEDTRIAVRDAIQTILDPFAQVTWLQTRFPDAAFADVPGLCAVVTTSDIKEQDWSLTPGRYVGVAPPEPEDEEAVAERLAEIHAELAGLNEEAAELAAKIAGNFEEVLG